MPRTRKKPYKIGELVQPVPAKAFWSAVYGKMTVEVFLAGYGTAIQPDTIIWYPNREITAKEIVDFIESLKSCQLQRTWMRYTVGFICCALVEDYYKKPKNNG